MCRPFARNIYRKIKKRTYHQPTDMSLGDQIVITKHITFFNRWISGAYVVGLSVNIM